ncbi:MAG: hypothetical protein F6J87_15355 [Spirulina sp. SIO3F2]|nr:hypothetical protein [Spirulina sp. SIO3F2]
MKPLNRYRHRSSGVILLLLIVVWSLLIALGLTFALGAQQGAIAKGVDVVPERVQNAQDVYLDSCTRCHVPVPPELLPTRRWAEILENPESHFGVNLRQSNRSLGVPPLSNIEIRLMWDYVQRASRSYREDELLPTQVKDSRFFWALHPKVKDVCQRGAIDCPNRISVQTCATCHTAAPQFDYRQLTPEWDNSP